MVLEVIYVVRHGFRSHWVVNAETGVYTGNVRSPTGIPSDPALTSYGEKQAEELAIHTLTLQPPIDVIYSSPFYRCLQTIKPLVEKLSTQQKVKSVRVENGLGDFYGLARFDHPSPAPLPVLHTHFPNQLHKSYKPVLIPSANGESISALHDRIAYTMHRIIAELDADPAKPKAVLISTHAASMIAMGRVLTGTMPEDIGEEDFKCFTCSLSRFERKNKSAKASRVELWNDATRDHVPDVDWRDGKGLIGGWDCVVNGDCSFLSGGEERGWRFSGDEAFLTDPNAFNDEANDRSIPGKRKIMERRGHRL